MFGPGAYVPAPTEGIVDVTDLPVPKLVAYDRHHKPPPAHDATTSPRATHPASAPCTTLAMSPPVARLPSWSPPRRTLAHHAGSLATSICPMSPHPAVMTPIG